MRVHNQIRADATLRENKVLLLNNCTAYTFLPMSAAELVTNLWSASLANYEINTQIAILVREEHCPIYHCCLSSQTTMFKWTWPILTVWYYSCCAQPSGN
uniref:Uncharacterized protein n=1 Tax=Opuntia streptacantha TaxID=393608 RepID=A0A7C8YXN7_OPUST